MSDKWFDAICWSSFLLTIFIIKKCVAFSFMVSGTLKYDFEIKAIEILSFFLLKTNQWP